VLFSSFEFIFVVLPLTRLAFYGASRWVEFATERGAIALLGPGEHPLRGETYAFTTEYHLNDLGVQQLAGRLAAALLRLFAQPIPAPLPASKRPDRGGAVAVDTNHARSFIASRG
jgi:hypothetical protein